MPPSCFAARWANPAAGRPCRGLRLRLSPGLFAIFVALGTGIELGVLQRLAGSGAPWIAPLAASEGAAAGGQLLRRNLPRLNACSACRRRRGRCRRLPLPAAAAATQSLCRPADAVHRTTLQAGWELAGDASRSGCIRQAPRWMAASSPQATHAAGQWVWALPGLAAGLHSLWAPH